MSEVRNERNPLLFFLTCGIRSNVEVGHCTEEARRRNLTGLELWVSFACLI